MKANFLLYFTLFTSFALCILYGLLAVYIVGIYNIFVMDNAQLKPPSLQILVKQSAMYNLAIKDLLNPIFFDYGLPRKSEIFSQ
ncbi:hypothetical protein [Helicobacter rodentium]|uniref:hypothetical protein n=1 Tax=Helicobacter rodentium TaxID=59617 RepID=UPI002356B897|nr:hypothetical protein [Helicobacter rodentium]